MRFSCESATDRSAHDGTACVCRAREATAQRARPTGRFVLVACIVCCLGLPLPAGLHPVTTDNRHGENDNPNKHACLLGGVSPTVQQGRGRTALSAHSARKLLILSLLACVTKGRRRACRHEERQIRPSAYETVASRGANLHSQSRAFRVEPHHRQSSSSTMSRSSGMRRGGS